MARAALDRTRAVLRGGRVAAIAAGVALRARDARVRASEREPRVVVVVEATRGPEGIGPVAHAALVASRAACELAVMGIRVTVGAARVHAGERERRNGRRGQEQRRTGRRAREIRVAIVAGDCAMASLERVA
jgi:hypothetical protein